jgi:hypothetical protein
VRQLNRTASRLETADANTDERTHPNIPRALDRLVGAFRESVIVQVTVGVDEHGSVYTSSAQGHGAPHVVALPPGHTTGFPAAQLLKRQFCDPASPDGQLKTHAEPAAQSAEHGPDKHAKEQLLPAPHWHAPLAHSPLHAGLLPAQAT